MAVIKEVTVFTTGDSSKPSTWSNVPYFFTEALIQKGLKVNRIDIAPDPNLSRLWNKTMGRLIRRVLNPSSTFDYFRSRLHYINVQARIKRAVKQYPNSDAFIFLTLSFSAKHLTKKPVVLFSDWTYEHHIDYYQKRKPFFSEQQFINRENKKIETADIVLPLFPVIAQHMKQRYRNKNIYYLGNVINSVYEAEQTEALQQKVNSFDLLFVGSPKYLEGALSLITAFESLKKSNKDLKLHFIGMTQIEIGRELPPDVFAHGYLDKAVENERKLYYDLFSKAKLFINTTPQWGAFSATIEAMYFYTPVIVTPYSEFVETFGRDLKSGIYAGDNSPAEIIRCINLILTSPEYSSLCIASHNAVKEYTWSAYIKKVIDLIELKTINV